MKVLQTVDLDLVEMIQSLARRQRRGQRRVIGDSLVDRFAPDRVRFLNGLLAFGGVHDEVDLVGDEVGGCVGQEVPRHPGGLGLGQVANGDADQVERGTLPAREQRAHLLAAAAACAPLAGRTYTQSINDALLRLESSAAAFDYTCNGDDAREKRTARRRRQQAITAMNLLLAELGEAELLGELARCSVNERLERLREWIAQTGAKPR